MTHLGRIAQYLHDEACPRTPQEISRWTKLPLDEVYEILQGNEVFFIEIIENEELKGWITAW